MQLLAPDILAEARGLSVTISAWGLAFGILLWLMGWRWHRFWIVLLATSVGGVFGLNAGPVYGVQPLVAGLLLAVGAGALALTLVRVAAFFAGGVAACLLAWTFAPGWDEPLVSFILGGLAGMLLFRWWTMLLTSMVGTLFMGYSAFCLADTFHKIDAVTWTTRHATFLNWLCGVLTFLGLGAQLLQERRRARKEKAQKDKAKEKEAKSKPPPPKKPWWTLGLPLPLQKAG